MISNATRYVLLDGAKIEDLPKRIYSLEDSPAVEWLYHKTTYKALFEIGPALVALHPESALEQNFMEHWQHDAGLVMESHAPMPELAEHLRSLIHARTTGDVSLLFRYYDPRVMRHWLPYLGAAEKDRMMGPIHRLRLPPRLADNEQWIVREQAEQSTQLYAERPWLYLDEQQLQQLSRGKLELFDQQLLEHVREYFPESLAGYTVVEQLKWAAACREGAARYGYSAPNEVSRWAALVAAHGTAFPDGPEYQLYRQILQQPTLAAPQRMDALLLELHRRLLPIDQESLRRLGPNQNP